MLSRLVFSVTYDCPVTCKYCVTRSGPHNGPCLSADFMISAIKETAALGLLRGVVFTGGEPLLKQREVERVVRFAASRKLWTRIVTNAYWATTRDRAEKILLSLKEAGLSEINFSCDDLHQENIPIKCIANAFWAARDLQMPTLIAHKSVKDEKISIQFLSHYLGVDLKEFKPGRENARFDIYSSAYTVPIGFGTEWLKEADYIIFPNRQSFRNPCSAVFNCLVVSPTRQIKLCCGMIDQDVPELSFGCWGDLPLEQLICDANTDLIANWLALEGPYGIMRFIQERAPQNPFRNKYVNHCHLCNDIFTREEHREVLLDYAREKAEALFLRRGLLEAIRFKDAPSACFSAVG
jgi:organic radical activating enzyme